MKKQSGTIRRRGLLGFGLAATAAGTLSSCSRTGGGPHWRVLTAEEATAVQAICEQLIPADDFAGAAQAGVANFIDLQLATHYRKHRAAYRKGLAELDAACRKKFSKGFAALPAEEQVTVLSELEEAGSEFFSLIRSHAMQGFYGDPRHGGNRGAASWKMLGLPVIPVRGRLPGTEAS